MGDAPSPVFVGSSAMGMKVPWALTFHHQLPAADGSGVDPRAWVIRLLVDVSVAGLLLVEGLIPLPVKTKAGCMALVVNHSRVLRQP